MLVYLITITGTEISWYMVAGFSNGVTGTWYFGLSIFTNTVATLFIGMTLWGHLRFLRKIGISHRTFIGSWRILALLLDSGVIYCVLQVMMFALQFHRVTQYTYAFEVFSSLYRSISCVYPSLTIFLIREVSSVEAVHNSVVALQMSEEPPAQTA
ncbi:hypothetical protein H2248_011832 [Termitomyces sp. 'cryptogamus']|nr:hypothetical protein H2248_011832 [Termitomyces sp. 'cryptogamus']